MPDFKKLPLTSTGELMDNDTPILQSPDDLIVVSFPKNGKTLTMVNQPNILIGDADPEGGTRYFNAKNVVNLLQYEGTEEFVQLKNGAFVPAGLRQTVDELYKANRMKEYWELRNKLDTRLSTADKTKIYEDLVAHVRGIPFPIFAVDTVTSLQELNWGASLAEYNSRFPTKKKSDIKKVDDYGGSQYIRANFIAIKNFISQMAAPFKLWTGHIKEKKKVLVKTGDDISVADMALEGQLGTIFTSRAHAVCTFYRNDKGCFLDFTKKEETDFGSRPLHLSNKVIKIADLLKEGETLPTTHWDLVYPELKWK